MIDGAPLNPALAAAFPPPVMEARRWLAGLSFPPDRPLINVSQAAPVDPPPLALRQAMADAALNRPDAHLYGPVLGNPDLRAAVAGEFSRSYGGTVEPGQVAITQGCNQAFCAAITTLAQADAQPGHWVGTAYGVLEAQGQKPVVRPFAALNTAFATDGVLIHVTGRAAKPVSLIYVHNSDTSDAILHHCVKLDPGAMLPLGLTRMCVTLVSTPLASATGV